MALSNNVSLGREAEDLVLKIYLQRKYTLVARNFQYYGNGRSGRRGEIDLIMENLSANRPELVIIEVKYRQEFSPAFLEKPISYKQIQGMYYNLAKFIQKYPIYKNYTVRIDAALVTKNKLKVIANCQNFDWTTAKT